MFHLIKLLTSTESKRPWPDSRKPLPGMNITDKIAIKDWRAVGYESCQVRFEEDSEVCGEIAGWVRGRGGGQTLRTSIHTRNLSFKNSLDELHN